MPKTSRTHFVDRARYAASSERSAELTDIINELTAAVDPQSTVKSPNAPEWTRKGMAAVQKGAPNGMVQSKMYASDQYVDALRKQLNAAKHEKVIADAAAQLFAPLEPLPQTTPRKPPGGGGGIPNPGSRTAAASGPIALLLELLTYSGDLNSGEQEKLDSIYGKQQPNVMPAPSADEIVRALQQFQMR